MNELHWFLIVYEDTTKKYIRSLGLSQKKITVPILGEHKKDNDIPEEALATTISYLGYMTKAEFAGESNV